MIGRVVVADLLICVVVVGSTHYVCRSWCAWLREFLPSYFSTILAIPDNPEEGVLFLTKSALNALNKYSWDRSQALKSLALLDGIKLLVSACQESYPYSYQVNT